MVESVEIAEKRRLEALQIQAATFGSHTDPAILIEIQELTRRNRGSTFIERRQLVNNLDYDFLMTVVSAALVRLGAVEANLTKNDRRRVLRQLIHDIWMVTITTMVFLILWMQVVHK
jgi:hypothetical protein